MEEEKRDKFCGLTGGMSRIYGFDLANISFYYELRIESLSHRQMYKLSLIRLNLHLRGNWEMITLFMTR
jgi:hypothetical protein